MKRDIFTNLSDACSKREENGDGFGYRGYCVFDCMRTVQKCAESVGAATHWYHAEDIHCAPEGTIKVQVKLNKQFAKLPLHVVKVDAPPLFGREWLGVNYLNWKDLKIIHAEEQRENDNCG